MLILFTILKTEFECNNLRQNVFTIYTESMIYCTQQTLKYLQKFSFIGHH